jgi:hypothetical protein
LHTDNQQATISPTAPVLKASRASFSLPDAEFVVLAEVIVLGLSRAGRARIA